MVEVAETALGELQASMWGEVILPDDPTYDEHRRVWNGSIDRRPALVARCRDTDDVAAGLRSAAGDTASRASRCATTASSSIWA